MKHTYIIRLTPTPGSTCEPPLKLLTLLHDVRVQAHITGCDWSVQPVALGLPAYLSDKAEFRFAKTYQICRGTWSERRNSLFALFKLLTVHCEGPAMPQRPLSAARLLESPPKRAWMAPPSGRAPFPATWASTTAQWQLPIAQPKDER